MNIYRGVYLDLAEFNPQQYLCVRSCGNYIVNEADFETSREKGRADYQLIYIVSGTLRRFDVQPSRDLQAGSVVLYEPLQRQRYNYIAAANTEAFWLHFGGMQIPSVLRELHLEAENYIGQVPQITDLFHRIMTELRLKKSGFMTACNSLILEVLTSISRAAEDYRNPAQDKKLQRLKQVVDLMHQEDKPKAVEEYANLCFMSKYRFIHVFKQLMGIPPHAYQTQLTLQKARDLLINSDLSITEIAETLGFSDIYYFSRFFKTQTKLSPMHFRKEYNKV